MYIKIITACFALFLLLAILPACNSNVPSELTNESLWTVSGNSVSAWFDENEPDDFMGVNIDSETMRVGKSPQGQDIFSLLHLPLRADLLPDEIESAKLYLRIAEGETPSALDIGFAGEFWGENVTALSGAKKLKNSASVSSVDVKKEENGWVSMDITGYVTEWLSGDVPNYGLVMLGKTAGEQTVFASYWDEGSKTPPRLEVRGVIGDRDLSYGKFGYLRHPELESDDAIISENETANCLSYALRDTDVIGAEELALDYGVLTEIYRESGEDAVADFCAGKVAEYVERNKSGLKISSFRQIEGYDSEIDPKKEYRIAFRVGCRLYGDDDVLDDVEGNFDYHVRAQINTGQWAQKYMFDPSEIVPGTHPGVSPEKYPWDSTLEWGWEKFFGTITSKAVYFAVTKDVDGFTQHKTDVKTN